MESIFAEDIVDGCDMHSVNAALKRHEAIHTDVDARVSSVLYCRYILSGAYGH